MKEKRDFMAPESERAKCKHERLNMEGVCPCGYWVGDPTAHLRKPTLTCSEVVERLQECMHAVNDGRYHGYRFDRNKAYAILHSWRERRVQELEECLRRIGTHSGDAVCDVCMILISKHSGDTYSTDSAARITSDPATKEIRGKERE